ncbi:MAG: hypothetical protein U0936_03920 [Planctomycetaceae bacterium]
MTKTELEGDWHRVGASVDQTGAETPHFNITIHGSTWTKFVEGKPEVVEFLCDTAKKTIEFKSTPPIVYTCEMHGDAFILHNETQSQAFNRGHRLQPDVLSELEGDWHQISAMDKDGKPLTVRPVNMSFKKDQYTLAYQGGQNNRRVEVFSGKKEIRYFQEGEYNGFVQDHYLLEGDQLTIYDENRRNVYQRGHVALPKSIPAATDEQKSLWRSGIVNVIVQPRQTSAKPPEREHYGYGVIVSPQGMMISQLTLSDGDWIFFAKFDDGGVIPIKLVEEGIQGWTVFQPEQPIEVNHHYRLSTEAVGKDDEVNFWGRAAVPGNHPTLGLYKSNVTALDRKSPALGLTVWQLHAHDTLDATLPILDGNGDVLAISAIGTGDLFLAVPISQLKTMFPKSLGLLTATEKPAESKPIP